MAGWHELYRQRYAKLKAEGKPFFPYAVVKDAFVAFLILALLVFLAWKYGAALEGLADPTDTTYNPRPEWYFLFMFQALKAFPGSMEAVGAVLLPGLGVGALLFLPLFDRGPERHPLDRPLATGVGILAIIGVTALTVAGLRSPLINPTVERDPQEVAGLRLYRDLNCAYCHKISGKGGSVGPELDKVVGQETTDWIKRHLRDPKAATPGSTMPKMNLLDEEIDALTAYLQSIGGEPFTKEAPKLFTEHCAACHRIGKEGEESGPDLSAIGSARDKSFLKRYISDPVEVNPAAGMPGFKEQLTDVQIEDLARYLSSLGR